MRAQPCFRFFASVQIIIVAWTVVSAVALANLLIAILSFKYRPDDIEPESAYQQVENLLGL